MTRIPVVAKTASSGTVKVNSTGSFQDIVPGMPTETPISSVVASYSRSLFQSIQTAPPPSYSPPQVPNFTATVYSPPSSNSQKYVSIRFSVPVATFGQSTSHSIDESFAPSSVTDSTFESSVLVGPPGTYSEVILPFCCAKEMLDKHINIMKTAIFFVNNFIESLFNFKTLFNNISLGAWYFLF